MPLFQDVVYHLIPPTDIILKRQLDNNAATQAQDIQHATHVISHSNHFDGCQNLPNHVHLVSPQWVSRSVFLEKIQPPQFYSTDPAMIFSSVVACAAELPVPDLEVLSAGITALGGQWRMGLTKEVTILFATSKSSHKYATAFEFQPITGVKVLLPHYFDDSVRLGIRNLDTTPYAWPDPPLLKSPNQQHEQKKSPIDQDPVKRNLFSTATQFTPDFGSSDLPLNIPNKSKSVWDGRKILLSCSLQLHAGRRDAVEVGIRRGGGHVVNFHPADDSDSTSLQLEEAEHVDECDILITRWRSGKSYTRAFKASKTIGTLAWLFHVQHTGVLTQPLDQLLHYPIPKRPVDGFSAHEITVTNYTGEAREYLKKLITTMGATFTPNMSGHNTVLIAAYISGQKTTKAVSWSIPIVNHTWLEDCFVQWRNLTVATEKYILFTPGVDFSTLLGERGIGARVMDFLEEAEQELEEKMAAANPVVPEVTVQNVVMDTERNNNNSSEKPDDDQVVVPQKKLVRRVTMDSVSLPATHSETINPSPKAAKGLLKSTKGDASTRVKRKSKPNPITESDSTSNDLVIVVKKKSKGKHKSRPQESDSSDSQISLPESLLQRFAKKELKKKVESKLTSPEKPATPATPASSSKRVVTAVLPTSVDNKGTEDSPKKMPTRTESLRVTAGEQAKSPTTRLAVSKRKPRDVPPPLSSSPTPIPSDPPPRRSAATRATQRLRDEIMPDVVNFEQQMKKSRKSTSGMAHFITQDVESKKKVHAQNMSDVESEDKEDTAPPHNSKRKVNSTNVESEDEERTTKRRKTESGQKKGKGRKSSGKSQQMATADASEAEDETALVEVPAPKKGRKSMMVNETDASVIRLMTTQVSLPDHVMKVLMNLGVKTTTRTAECTHLVVHSLVRTEKFLCALAAAPFVLTEKWALDSAAAKRLLPEKNYLLNDKVGEKKFGFKLSEAIERAKTHQGKLLQNKTFYVTAKVPVDIKLLKNVVSACGGQITTQTPTVRIIGANLDRHVISCSADISTWRPLVAQNIPIYTQELILTGALKQLVEWDNKLYRVSESL